MTDVYMLCLAQGKPKLTEHPIVLEVAKRLGATEAQVLISWHAARGCSVIPKSVTEGKVLSPSLIIWLLKLRSLRTVERIKSNFYQVELSSTDTQQLDDIGKTNPSR